MYDKSWARSVVSNWWKLCTRTQLLSLHYEQIISIYYPSKQNPSSRILFDDLVVLLARSKADKAAGRLWVWFKRYADDGIALKDHDEARVALKYAQIYIISSRGLKEHVQQCLF